jgi:hypothetical protein
MKPRRHRTFAAQSTPRKLPLPASRPAGVVEAPLRTTAVPAARVGNLQLAHAVHPDDYLHADDRHASLGRIVRKCASCDDDIRLKGIDISQPHDEEEVEADRVEGDFAAGRLAGSMSRDGASAAVRRKPTVATHALPAGQHPLAMVASSGGRPLTRSERVRYESFFQADLSTVRIHDNAAAARAARGLNAHAFARGTDLYFADGRYQEGTAEGRGLLAHELTHTLQSGDGVRRKGDLDASNTDLWDQFSSSGSRQRMPDIYNRLLSSATGNSLSVQKRIEEDGKPKNDTEREILERRFKKLVRLNALGLMAAHRATIQGRRDVTLGKRREPGDTRTDKAVEKDTASQIRGAVDKVRHLRGVRDELKDFRSELNIVRADSIKSLTFPVEDWFKTIADNSWKYISPARRNYLRQVAVSVGQIKDKNTMRLLVYFTAQSLTEWRDKQIEGATAAIDLIFRAYPFFTQWEDFLSMPSVVVGPVDDRKMMEEVRKAYDKLIDKIDDATVRIGSGDIEELDLPVPVENTRGSLPKDLQADFDAMVKDREVAKFRNELLAGGAQLVLVFIPVVGPALAAAVGVGMLAMSLEDMLDKAALSGAAGNESGTLLGVSGPKDYEWAMLAVQAALTIADLGAVAKQMRAGGSMASGVDELLPKWQAAARKERDLLLEAGELDAKKLSIEHLNAEYAVVRRSRPQASAEPGYTGEVDVGNGHVWRRRPDGTWCRFSSTPELCGTVISGADGGAKPLPPKEVGASDIDAMRKKYKILGQQDTLAVGRSDVEGLEDLTFEGASPAIRAEADIPSPTPQAKSPRQNVMFADHAEQDVVNAFIDAVETRGIPAEAMEGKALRIHISNPAGVCSACAQGTGGAVSIEPGVLMNLKRRYPGLTIRVTWNKADGSLGGMVVD